MMMSRAREEELQDRDYCLKTFGADETKAREFVDKKKAEGYFVRFAEYATRIRGFHHYGVWYKAKKGIED